MHNDPDWDHPRPPASIPWPAGVPPARVPLGTTKEAPIGTAKEAAAELPTLSVSWPPPDIAQHESPLPKWAGVARLGGVGDNLITASVLRPLKRMGYSIDVITESPHHVVYQNNPFIDKLSVKVSATDLPVGDMLAWQQWFNARGREYDKFVNLSHSCENLIALFPASSTYWWPVEFRRKLCSRNYLEAVHDICGVPHEFGRLFFPTRLESTLAQETKAKVAKLYGDGRVIGWVLSGTRIDKVYGNLPIVVARIVKELGLPVILFGAPTAKDMAIVKSVQDIIKMHNGNLDGVHSALSPDPDKPLWPIRRVLSQVLTCDLMIGPDTGPMWAAAFEPMPKVSLLSHASAENITKHWINTITLHADQVMVPCSPCHRLHDSPATCVVAADGHQAACMADLSADLLMTAIEAALGDISAREVLAGKWASRAVLPAPVLQTGA